MRLENIAASNRFYPVTDKVRQVDWHGGFTAAAGHALYTARTYPRHYWNQTAFVAEPTGHLVATFTLERQGSDVADYYGWNLVASDDEWTAPISAEVGPDGHVWVIDWYNFIVQHNPTPHGFKTGKGNAYETPLRDKTHGRIYRIVFKEAPPSRPPVARSLASRGPGVRLCGTTINYGGCTPSGFWSSAARPTSCRRLIELVRDGSVDAIGLNPGVIHALWTLHGLGALAEFDASPAAAAMAALKHPSAGVRRNAVQVLPRDARSAAAVLAAGLLHDPDAQVRLAALLEPGRSTPSDQAGAAVAEALRGGLASNDPLAGRCGHGGGSEKRRVVLEGRGSTGQNTAGPGRVADRGSRGRALGPGRSGRRRSDRFWLLCPVASRPSPSRFCVDSPAAGPKTALPRSMPGTAEVLKKLTIEWTRRRRRNSVRLVGAWGDQALDQLGAEIAASLLASVKDERLADSPPDRCRAAVNRAASRGRNRRDRAPGPDHAGRLAGTCWRARRRRAASKAPEVGEAFVAALPRLSPSVRSRVLQDLARSRRLGSRVCRLARARPGQALGAGARSKAGSGGPPQCATSPRVRKSCWPKEAACPTAIDSS